MAPPSVLDFSILVLVVGAPFTFCVVFFREHFTLLLVLLTFLPTTLLLLSLPFFLFLLPPLLGFLALVAVPRVRPRPLLFLVLLVFAVARPGPAGNRDDADNYIYANKLFPGNKCSPYTGYLYLTRIYLQSSCGPRLLML